jgi:hypothetical protein
MGVVSVQCAKLGVTESAALASVRVGEVTACAAGHPPAVGRRRNP